MKNNGKARQVVAAFIVNLLSMSYGICVGWPSPTIKQLRSSHPPIGDTPLSLNQMSWMSSILPIGGLLMAPFCGTLVESLGRKYFAQLTALPFIVSWLLVVFAQSHVYLFVARLFVGVAGAMTFLAVPLYVSEIASEDIRGLLGSLLLLSLNVGVLFAYVAGAFLSYTLFASLSLLGPLIFIAASAFIPETPVYLLRRNRRVQARKSLMFFRGDNEVLAEQEMRRLQSQVNTSSSSSSTVRLSDLFKDRSTRKGLVISIGLLAGQQSSGIYAMVNYAETIFKLMGSSISSDVASIMIAVIQIFGSYASTMLIERAGRRLLTLVSCFGMAVSHCLIGLFFYLQHNQYDVSLISWLPLVAVSTYIVAFCLGVGPVPFVFISEVFNLNVNSLATTVCLLCTWILSFTGIRIFDLAMLLVGTAGCFFTLATFCATCFLFSYCLVPETKGREREDIVRELAGIDKSKNRKSANDVDKSTESKVLTDAEAV